MKRDQEYSKFPRPDGDYMQLRALRRGDLPQLLKFANALAAEKRSNRDLGIVGLDARVTRATEEGF
jgi:hypothetical protein